MQDAKADMPEGDKAAWNAMLDGWRKELARVGEEWGPMQPRPQCCSWR